MTGTTTQPAGLSQAIGTDGKPARTPRGGFVFVTAPQLTMVWWAYSRGLIRLIDLRTWFACWEMLARRCCLERGQTPRYSRRELLALTGGAGEGAVAASLRRLEAMGLLSWSEAAISFPASPDAIPGSLSGYWEFLSKVENNRRRVPVPRRVVRFIAGGAGRVLTATILGHLFRCMYYRNGECAPTGNCRASWIASLFGVALPNVKAARTHLIRLGLFEVTPMPQWHRNRWGARVTLNLAWSEPSESAAAEAEPATNDVWPHAELRPPQGQNATGLRPPCLNQELSPSSRTRNQKPAPGGPTGFLEPKTQESPTLRNVVPRDLDDTGRLLELWRQACAAGKAKPSEHGRLHFVAMAEHARVYGSRNPCGLFAWLLTHEQWVTQADEDEASRRLKRHLFPPNAVRPAVVTGVHPVQPKLSELGIYATAIRRVVVQQRLNVDPWILAKQHRPSLTREEWDAATAESENQGLLRARAQMMRPSVRDGCSAEILRQGLTT